MREGNYHFILIRILREEQTIINIHKQGDAARIAILTKKAPTMKTIRPIRDAAVCTLY